MSKHTPGPWAAFERSNAYSMMHPKIMSDTGGVAMAFWAGAEEKTDANARLIAAAPDLLEALKLAAAIVNPGSALEKTCNAAIAKAEGKQ